MKKQIKCLLIDKLIQDGWFDDEKEAVPWIMTKKVLVNDRPAVSCKEKINADSVIRIREYYKKRYVNKGGLKLESALKHFNIDVKNKAALDCGASTGGFTDCLICHGAEKVYAVDAGNGQLAGKLTINPKVVNLEKTNLSDRSLCELNPAPEIITLDLSYLSLVKALPVCGDILKNRAGIVVCLVKPIYEVESSTIRRTGKVNDKDIHRNILNNLCDRFIEQRISVLGVTNSPVTGNNGTLEYFIHLEINNDAEPVVMENLNECIETALEQAFKIKKFEKDNYS